jgi:phosphoribosylglycinamide formyltransferase-1
MSSPTRLGVLLSGRGSNFLAIHEAITRGDLPAEIVCVVSNKADARGLEIAQELGLHAELVDHRGRTREEHERAVREVLDQHRVGVVCLAGYMRRLTAEFVNAYPMRILNVHPSLLPAFIGVDAQQQAVDHGVKITGCTVHFVTEELDGGPILVQRSIAVFPHDTGESLAARLLPEEHRAYVEALQIVCGGAYRVEGRRVLPI